MIREANHNDPNASTVDAPCGEICLVNAFEKCSLVGVGRPPNSMLIFSVSFQCACEAHHFAKSSATGTRTRVARVRAEYPNQLDYSGSWLRSVAFW